MVVALLISLFITTVSGLKLYAVEDGLGPLANNTPENLLISKVYADDHDEEESDEADEELWEEIHEIAANFTLFLVFLHIAGVIVSSRLHHENLVKAMITGNKKGMA